MPLIKKNYLRFKIYFLDKTITIYSLSFLIKYSYKIQNKFEQIVPLYITPSHPTKTPSNVLKENIHRIKCRKHKKLRKNMHSVLLLYLKKKETYSSISQILTFSQAKCVKGYKVHHTCRL